MVIPLCSIPADAVIPLSVLSGVALAWPLEKYEALTVDITRLSETRTWGRAPKPISASAGDSSAAEESPSPEKIERKKAPLSIPIRGLLSTLVVNMKKQRGEEEGTAALENGEERDTRDDDIERVTEPWKVRPRGTSGSSAYAEAIVIKCHSVP